MTPDVSTLSLPLLHVDDPVHAGPPGCARGLGLPGQRGPGNESISDYNDNTISGQAEQIALYLRGVPHADWLIIYYLAQSMDKANFYNFLVKVKEETFNV